MQFLGRRPRHSTMGHWSSNIRTIQDLTLALALAMQTWRLNRVLNSTERWICTKFIIQIRDRRRGRGMRTENRHSFILLRLDISSPKFLVTLLFTLILTLEITLIIIN